MMTALSLLEVTENVDVLPYSHEFSTFKNFDLTTFRLITHDSQQEIGRIIPYVIQVFLRHYDFLKKFIIINTNAKTVTISSELNTFEKRSQAFAEIAEYLRATDELDTLKGWRNELFTCYYPSKVVYFTVERSLAPALGIQMYGIHINGYIPPEESKDGNLKLWVARRSLTKPTFPGMLDNTIAGGIAYPYSIYDTVMKESMEEANVDRKYVEDNISSAGVLTYLFTPKVPTSNEGKGDFFYTESHDEDHFVQPECEFIYDLRFSELEKSNATIVGPAINDDEVSGFMLMTVEETLEAVKNGKFKPNCAIVVIDFLMRKGYITPSNEPNYVEISRKIHRHIAYPGI